MSEELTYRAAGVDIDEAQSALRAVAPLIKASQTESVIGGIGGFGGLFRGDFPDMERPILVSSIDGVGTKTRVAAMAGDYSGLGYDIVHHCVNDILCQGARPLYFLDYYGTSRLNGPVFEAVVGGLATACANLGMALLGGETAEMPGVYVEEEVDIVGAIVGVVESDRRLPRKPTPGDVLIGIASAGLHTNGFSLARRALFEVGGVSVRDTLSDGRTFGEALLTPHRCYFPSIFPLLGEASPVRGMAHITGGGLLDNVPRALPSDQRAVIDKRSWTAPEIFRRIQDAGNIAEMEMYRTFNMGIGMVLIVESQAADTVVAALGEAGEHAAVIGHVQEGATEVQLV